MLYCYITVFLSCEQGTFDFSGLIELNISLLFQSTFEIFIYSEQYSRFFQKVPFILSRKTEKHYRSQVM